MSKKPRKSPQVGSEQATNPPSRQKHTLAARRSTIPVVGIGASAGGLKAFEAFFTHLPPDTGMAFILIQHLNPDQKSMLAEILRRFTSMQVVELEQETTQIQPNCIYIHPSNRHMALMNGSLHLMEPVERRSLTLPIDQFFRSLAEDQGEQTIAVILSGTGTDGTLGIKEVKEVGGMVMAQQADNAEFDGMPRSAIATGLVDYILPAEAMGEQLVSYVEGSRTRKRPESPLSPEAANALERIFIILRSRTGHDFSRYKTNTLRRRIERRMLVNQITHSDEYARFLQQNPHEAEALFRELLIGVTSFFRDPAAFEALEKQAIPQLLDNRQPEQPIRIWVPACSTGEEAYSIAILMREAMDRLGQDFIVQIFATDIDSKAIDQARLGVYPETIAADVSAERMERYFIGQGSQFQIVKPIRDMVVFAAHSLLTDPPFSRLDLISCRNVLIYLSTEVQKEIIPLFHYALNSGGFLFLGSSETLGEIDHLFRPLDRKQRLYQRNGNTSDGSVRLNLPVLSWSEHSRAAVQPISRKKTVSLRETMEQVLLAEHTPTSALVDVMGDILVFHNQRSQYLEPADGAASLNIVGMVREDLRLPLSVALQKAVTTNQQVVYDHLPVQDSDPPRSIRLTVKPLALPLDSPVFLILFEEHAMSPPPTRDGDTEVTREQQYLDMEQMLQASQDYGRTVVEELKASNEELKASNEELQSSNEELMTTKEETQSVNEELTTVNAELETKIVELLNSHNDLSNLLSILEVGIIFLDHDLRVKRFNPMATSLVRLIESDIGRHIGDLATQMIEIDLLQRLETVKETLEAQEMVVQSRTGEQYLMRIKPYRLLTNAPEGLVITFTQQGQGLEQTDHD